MTRWLAARCPEASPALQLACRAQHFRRWEIPRSSYPMTRPGYLTWRAKLKSQAAAQVAELLASPAIEPALEQEVIDRVAALVRKENLKNDEETQILEDVACLVFLDDQFDDFEKKPEIDEEKVIGILRKTWVKMNPTSTTPTFNPSPTLSTPIKPPLSSLISTYDFMKVAHDTFPPKTRAFVFSAATDLYTHTANTQTFSSITLRPRILRNVSFPISLSTTFLSCPVSTPIFCAPTSLGKTVHPRGELELALGCRAAGAAQVISTSASYPLSAIAATTNSPGTTPHPLFLQLYVDKVRSRSESLIAEALRLGLKAIFLTVDAPVAGKREADERTSLSSTNVVVTSPTGVIQPDASGHALGRLIGSYVDPSLCWDDIPWLRSLLPPEFLVVIKGIQTASDAVRAMRAGVQGIVVSNHGGRSLDTSTPSVLVLLELQRCCPEVFERMEVFMDGGVMRGTDVFKCLCLGARGVGIGRGVLWGLGYGKEGVGRYFEVLNEELKTTMKMCGITSLDEVHPGLLNTRKVDHLVPEVLSEGHPYVKWRPKAKGAEKAKL
ncbi:cytochrome b2 [Podospora aff. communis PSN243]|uniref:Cytochrome b2 n=1 Tax=Podospora aff. communis PSN243 TaxID=3040156 RepID=A0AAV9GR53_9PEZI|nr:cytochrome b2 [Podospora aff. communis PSN243]